MKIVTVIPLKKGIPKEDLTYFTAKDTPTGSIVTIPIRNKNTLGLVISSEDVSGAKSDIKNMNFNLKKIIEIKEISIFRKEYLDATIETSKYFVASKNNTVTSLIPAILRENYDEIVKWKNSEIRPNIVSVASQNSIKTEKLVYQAPFEERISTYKTLIRSSFAEKKSIFILLPTENDIKKFDQLLSKGIEQFTFAIHGNKNTKKTLGIVERIVTTEHPILIIATAPFLSIPRNDIGVIILEHESASGYRTITRPHIDLRTFVELYASHINTKLILSDTILRFETIARTKNLDGIYDVQPLRPISFKINFEGKIYSIARGEKFKIFTDEVVEEIKNTLEHKKSIFIFSLRKGLATQTVCRDCNATLSCEKCFSPVVLYVSKDGLKRIFSCNKCKRQLNPETKCADCGSWNLMPLGIGTDTVVEELKKIFPKNNISKLDKDSVKTAKEAEKIIKNFEESTGSILVGTEMAFSYFKEKVPLSIIASFDSLWSIPNFKMSEKIIQILISILEHTKDKLIIQTKNENDPALLAIKNQNLLSFITDEIEDRKKLGYPPFKRFIKVIYTGDKEETLKAKEYLENTLGEYSPEIFSGFVAKQKGKYVTNMLVKMDLKADENLYSKLRSLPPLFEIFVDPEDLL